MLVYVLNKYGKPLMPCSPQKARKLLNNRKAKVVKKVPFTIQLIYGSTGYKQDISLGVDAGSKHIGISATTNEDVLFEADIELRNDIVENLSTRREARRSRRDRKTRYRKPRFKNRTKSKKKGWLAPSVRQKIETHLEVVKMIHKILPISRIIVETASFDIQKIKNPAISGVEYQQGDQFNFWNVREYILFRDNHVCQHCKGKSKDNILNVHHIESRKTGGDAPNNLITLCETCHKNYHDGKIKLDIKRGKSFKDATFMGIMRWAFYEKLKEIYENVTMTFGYITKNCRIINNLHKDHYIDARCISGNPTAKSDGIVYYFKKIRRHNRKIFKDKILKGNTKKRNQCSYEVFGFRRYDLVKFENKLYYINSLRVSGWFQIKDLIDKTFEKHISLKKLQFVQMRSGFISTFCTI